MRLIDADSFRDKILYNTEFSPEVINTFLDWIDDELTVHSADTDEWKYVHDKFPPCGKPILFLYDGLTLIGILKVDHSTNNFVFKCVKLDDDIRLEDVIFWREIPQMILEE